MEIKIKYDVGQKVWIEYPGMEGKIIGVWIYQGGRFEYQIEWWNEENRNTAYFTEERISPIKERKI